MMLQTFRKTMMLMSLLCVSLFAMAEESEVTINQPSSNNNWVPCYLTYNNTRAEMIYNASQLSVIGEGKTITSVAFDGVSSEAIDDVDFTLYVKETTSAQLTTEKADLSQFKKIFEGKANIRRNSDMTKYEEILRVPLDAPYAYTEGTALHFVLFTHSATKTSNVRFGHRSMSNVSGITYWNDGEESNERTTLYRTSYSPVLRLGLTSEAEEYESVTVGKIADTSCYGAPVSLSYTNSASETIYTASDLGLTPYSVIHGINYTGWVYNDDKGEKFHVKVWMQNTQDAAYSATSKATPKDGLTLVCDQEITVPKIGTMDTYTNQFKFKFDNDFTYTGQNLRVVVECQQVAGERGRRIYFGYDNSEAYANRTLVAEGSGELGDSRNLWVNGIPVTTFRYSAGNPVADRDPDVILHTSKAIGDRFGLVIHTTRGGIYIDYGNGEVWNYPYGGSLLINNDVAGPQVKIWKCDPTDLLQAVQSDDNGITKVEINTHDLEALYLRHNELKDGSIDFTNCDKLRILDLSYNHYYNFTYSSDVLTKLILSYNDLQQLDIPVMPSLTYLDASVNMLRSQAWIAWPGSAKNLAYLNLSYNMLYETPVSLWPELEELIINNNNYEALDLSKNTKLKKLYAFYTGLANLNVSKATELVELNLLGTKSTKLNLTSNTKLQILDVSKNNLGTLDLSKNVNLQRLVMSDALLTEFDFSPLKELTYLDFSKNSLSEPQLSALTKLNYLNCSENNIESINLDSNTALETLACSVNKLSEVDFSQLAELKTLDCSSNDLATLNIKANTKLERVNLYDNKLTSLDVKGLKALCGLNVKSNAMQTAQLQSLIVALPDVSALEVYPEDEFWKTVFAYAGNPGVAKLPATYADILTVKGWKAEVAPNILGDASAAFTVLPELVNTKIVFALDCGTAKKFSVDWGDGKKIGYTVTGDTYQNLEHVVLGNLIKIYCNEATELGIANLGVLDVDVSAMPKLNRLACSGNDINTLDLTKNTELEHLVCGNGSLTSISLPENSKLLQLYCTKSLIRNLDLSKCPLLEDLDVNSNRLESLDLSHCTNLLQLHAYMNELKSIDLSKSPMLSDVQLGYNQLSSIDVSKNTDLTSLSVAHNNLTSLDLTNNIFLTVIYCGHNKISDLKLNPSITTLLVGYNELEGVDLATVPYLEEIEMEHNKLKTIDLTLIPNVKRVWLGYNEITDIATPTILGRCGIFNAPNNRLTYFEASSIPYATELILNNNQLTGTLDLSKNNSLQQLYVSNNHISKIIYPTQPSLSILYAAYNKLTTFKLDCSNLYAVDLSNNNLVVASFANNPSLALLMLDCNQLASLNVEKNKALLGLTLRANLFDADELNSLYEQLPTISASATEENPWLGILAVSGNPGAATSSKMKARLKGWTVLYNENVGEMRNITISVVNAAGEPVADAQIVMLVNEAPISIQPEMLAEGVFAYENFPVITSEVYSVSVTAPGYNPVTVVLEGLAEGDVTIDVVLESNDPDGIAGISADAEKAAVEVFDLNGVRMDKDNIPAGVYIVKDASGKVTKRFVK